MIIITSPVVLYAGTVKRHNVYKRHFATDTLAVKQIERTIILHVISMGLKF